MRGTYPSGTSEAEENFVLTRFLDSIVIPDIPTYPALSEQSSPRRASRRPPSDPTTPDRPTVSFALPPQPRSPGGSTRSGYSNTRTITYKSPDYTTELQIRGIIEAENVPPKFDSIRKALERKSPALNALDKDTADGFNQLLVGPNNEATIQAVIVPNLVDQIGIVRNLQTYAINQAQFVAECVLPPLSQGEEITKIPSPCPDLTIGLWRASFRDYIVVLHKLGTMASPIGCAPDIIFPCFTIEVKGDPGANDGRMQNQNNAAHMLRHLRDLSSLAQGKEYTQKSFDGVVRVLSATVTAHVVTISAHWTVEKSNDVFYYSHLIKSIAAESLTYKEWNDVSRLLRNAINFVVNKTRAQVERNLKSIKDGTPMPSTPRGRKPATRPSATTSTSRKRRRDEEENY